MKKAYKNLRVFDRDRWTCQYCGQVDGETYVDHIVPRALGGDDSMDNLRTACRSCNSTKGTRDIEWLRIHRRLQASKYAGLISATQYMALVNAGVQFEQLPEYVFHFERAHVV